MVQLSVAVVQVPVAFVPICHLFIDLFVSVVRSRLILAPVPGSCWRLSVAICFKLLLSATDDVSCMSTQMVSGLLPVPYLFFRPGVRLFCCMSARYVTLAKYQ
jgi:hypothetical protein